MYGNQYHGIERCNTHVHSMASGLAAIVISYSDHDFILMVHGMALMVQASSWYDTSD